MKTLKVKFKGFIFGQKSATIYHCMDFIVPHGIYALLIY